MEIQSAERARCKNNIFSLGNDTEVHKYIQWLATHGFIIVIMSCRYWYATHWQPRLESQLSLLGQRCGKMFPVSLLLLLLCPEARKLRMVRAGGQCFVRHQKLAWNYNNNQPPVIKE